MTPIIVERTGPPAPGQGLGPPGQEEQLEIVPDVGEPPEPRDALELEEELAAGEAPVELVVPEPAPVGRSYAYDFVEQRLIPTPAGGPLMTYGDDSLRGWIEKTMRTERGAANVHDDDIGVEGFYELLDGGVLDESAIGEQEDRVRDALIVHPMIADIEDWQIVDAFGDQVEVAFSVVREDELADDIEIDSLTLTVDTLT